MPTFCHEIIKGAQLDTYLGNCCVCIQVGLPDHHFEQRVSLFVGSMQYSSEHIFTLVFAYTNSEFMIHL